MFGVSDLICVCVQVEHGKSLLLEQQRASDLEDQLKQQSTVSPGERLERERGDVSI